MGNAAGCRRPRLAHVGRARGGGRLAGPRWRPVPRELAGRACRLLGPPDRRDEGARPRRRLARRGGGRALGPRRRRRGERRSDRPATPRRSPPQFSRTGPRCRLHADAIRTRDDFPAPVGDAFAALAAEDVVGYSDAIEAVLESFETRDEYLEDLPVADTVMVLQALAARRGMAAPSSRASSCPLPRAARRPRGRAARSCAGRGRGSRESPRSARRRALDARPRPSPRPSTRYASSFVAREDRRRQRHARDERLERRLCRHGVPFALVERRGAGEERSGVPVRTDAVHRQVEDARPRAPRRSAPRPPRRRARPRSGARPAVAARAGRGAARA